MFKNLLISLVILMMPVYANAYEVVSETTITDGVFERTDTVVSVSEDPLDQFTVHRYRNTLIPECLVDRVLYLIPSLQSEWEMYLDGFAQSIAFFGVEVWGITPRYANLTPDCDVNPGNCIVSGTWDLQSYIDDVLYTRGVIEGVLPYRKVVMGGVSMGAVVPVATINEDPYSADGLFLLDGVLYSEDPEITLFNAPFCGMLTAMVDAGVYYDGSMGDFLKALVQFAQNDPDGASMFMPGLTNKQALVAFLDAPPPSPLSVVPDGKLIAGDVASATFYYADEDLLYPGVMNFLQYIPMVITRDVACSIAGSGEFVGENLGLFDGYIYAGGGSEGMASIIGDTLNLFINADTTISIDEGYGHVDSYYAKDRFWDLTYPLLDWIFSI
jgi:hypothetical protein